MTGHSSKRGTTRAGLHSPVPNVRYVRPPSVTQDHGRTNLMFIGEDRREVHFALGDLPLAGWHAPFAESWDFKAGANGSWRTAATARGYWGTWRDFINFLSQLIDPPKSPDRLTLDHMQKYLADRKTKSILQYAYKDLHRVGVILACSPMDSLVNSEVREFCGVRNPGMAPEPMTGYSDLELMQIIKAARTDVAAIRDRQDYSQALISKYESDRDRLNEQEKSSALRLLEIQKTGTLSIGKNAERVALMSNIYVTRPDMVPLLALLVSVTGLNVETVKELPAEHQLFEGRAVQLSLTKRRRGIGSWKDSVTWEIGSPSRALHTPGGLYLLVHRLMAASRQICSTDSLWAIWRLPTGGENGHISPFSRKLSISLTAPRWIESNGIVADHPYVDDRDSADPDSYPAGKPISRQVPVALIQGPQQLLNFSFNRLKTSVEVRRTKSLGGHLPSVARTNSVGVLYSNYLKDDPVIREWAGEIISDALSDAEALSLDGEPKVGEPPKGEQESTPISGSWSSCKNPEKHPSTDRECEASLLDCFSCANCVVTEHHLPHILALKRDMDSRRQIVGELEWERRYATASNIIQRDILPTFTPEQVLASSGTNISSQLDDLVYPWERP